VIETDRLRLVPLSVAHAQAAMNDPTALGSMLEVRIPHGWPGPDYASALPMIASALEVESAYAAWSRLIVERNERALVGDIGFKSLPRRDGSVEVGYSVVAEYRCRGYASEAARAMIAWAFSHDAVQRVIANCLNDNVASARVLQHAGMQQIGRSGPLLDWAIDRATWEQRLATQ
jgi:[ribosomal protein S5]-alanine N-acetyltransferase